MTSRNNLILPGRALPTQLETKRARRVAFVTQMKFLFDKHLFPGLMVIAFILVPTTIIIPVITA